MALTEVLTNERVNSGQGLPLISWLRGGITPRLIARTKWICCRRSSSSRTALFNSIPAPMKLLCVSVVSLLSIGVATAQDQPTATVRPQPRLRLDPARQAAVSMPVEPAKSEAKVFVLDRLVVKDRAIFRERPPAVEDPVGKFSPLSGGRFLRRDAGGVRFEVGIWPHIDLFEEESRFQPTKVLIQFDLLRIKF